MKCPKCGGKIVANIFIKDNFEFTLDEKGNLKELNCLFTDSLDELIRLYPKDYITIYYCEKCDNKGTHLEDLL